MIGACEPGEIGVVDAHDHRSFDAYPGIFAAPPPGRDAGNPNTLGILARRSRCRGSGRFGPTRSTSNPADVLGNVLGKCSRQPRRAAPGFSEAGLKSDLSVLSSVRGSDPVDHTQDAYDRNHPSFHHVSPCLPLNLSRTPTLRKFGGSDPAIRLPPGYAGGPTRWCSSRARSALSSMSCMIHCIEAPRPHPRCGRRGSRPVSPYAPWNGSDRRRSSSLCDSAIKFCYG